MRLATFAQRDGRARVGAVVDGGLIDVTGALGFASLRALLSQGTGALARVHDLLGDLGDGAEGHRHFVRESEALFLPPIPDPGKFLCVGKNYRAHLDELVRTDLIREIPEEPTGFIKLASVLVGQNAEVARPEGIIQLDYEPEFAFVIGKQAHRVTRERAMEHVAGITVFNDLTAREIQKREVKSGTRFWTAKNMPGFGPIGPWMVTLDEVPDVDDLWMVCAVNGQPRGRFSTSGQIYKIPDIIEHFSRYLPLEPGDVFSTGSPGGMAAAQPNAAELFLQPGDEVTVGIEGFLSLTTRIV